MRLPFFGFVVGRGTEGENHLWRQTNIDNSNAELVPDDAVPGADRVVAAHGRSVGVLICGELCRRRARQGGGQAGADLIVDIGHSGMGQGLIPAMRAVASEGGCPVAHSQHLGGWYGRSLHFVDGAGQQQSIRVSEENLVERSSLRAAWASRAIELRAAVIS